MKWFMNAVAVFGGMLIFTAVWAMDALDKSGIVYQLNDFVTYMVGGILLIGLRLAYSEVCRK